MTIIKNTVVSLDYEIWSVNNELLDKMETEPIIYLHGGYDDIFPKVEEFLQDKQIGDEIDIHLESEDAFGEIDHELIQIEPLENLPTELKPEDIKPGLILEATGEDEDDILLYVITDVAEGQAVLDANHPLAGQKIRFKAKVIDVRPAKEDEINQRFPNKEEKYQHH